MCRSVKKLVRELDSFFEMKAVELFDNEKNKEIAEWEKINDRKYTETPEMKKVNKRARKRAIYYNKNRLVHEFYTKQAAKVLQSLL